MVTTITLTFLSHRNHPNFIGKDLGVMVNFMCLLECVMVSIYLIKHCPGGFYKNNFGLK